MSPKELLQLIESGEGLKVEFKQRFSSYDKIAKEFIAFANTSGGVVLFGVNDNKTIRGVESEKGVAELIKQTAEQYCEPPLNYKLDFIEIDKKEVVIVDINESTTKPHRIQDYLPQLDISRADVYVRVNDKSILASKEMIKLLQTKSTGITLTNYEVGKNEQMVFEYLDLNETITVKDLSKLANISNRRASRTLIKLVRANLLIIHTKDNGESYFSYSGSL